MRKPSKKTAFNVAPIDGTILALLQIIQPASFKMLATEAKGTIISKILTPDQLVAHLVRLKGDSFILQTGSESFIVAPKAFPLVLDSLSGRARDKARLLELNKRRFQKVSDKNLGWEHR